MKLNSCSFGFILNYSFAMLKCEMFISPLMKLERGRKEGKLSFGHGGKRNKTFL